jgi:hypothetical protein
MRERNDGDPSGARDRRIATARFAAFVTCFVAAVHANGCKAARAPEPRQAPVVAAAPPASAAPPATVEDAQPALSNVQRDLASVLCAAGGEGRTCRFGSEHPAGLDPEGNTLSVVRLTVAVEDAAEPCEADEYWRITLVGDRLDDKERVLEARCEGKPARDPSKRGEGASSDAAADAIGAKERAPLRDDVQVGDNEIERVRSGGGAWRFRTREVLQLVPRRMRREDRSAWWSSGSNFESSRWSWDDFAGVEAWFSPRCGPDGRPRASRGTGPEPKDHPQRYEYVPIPVVELDEGFRTTGWQQDHLGRCAAVVSASGESGYVLQGKRADADDASLRAVVSTRGELFVEIYDDRWTLTPRGGSKQDDHLEVWFGGELPSYQLRCVRPRGEASAVGVRAADGKVFPIRGRVDVPKLRVERTAQTFGDHHGWVHFKMRLPPRTESITLVYRDRDSGKRIERAIATSRFDPSDANSLGALRVIPARVATCRVREGRLEPEWTQGAGR